MSHKQDRRRKWLIFLLVVLVIALLSAGLKAYRLSTSDYRLAEARYLVESGNYDQALGIYDRLLENDATNPQLIIEAGDLHILLGQTEEGLARFQEALVWSQAAGDRQLEAQIRQRLEALHLLKPSE